MNTSRILFLFTLAFGGAWPALAALGPDYQRPDLRAPIAWKDAASNERLPEGDWWKLFGDASLNALEERGLEANQNLRVAAARVEQARAALGSVRSQYFPDVGLRSSSERARSSETTDNRLPVAESSTYRGALEASWELDLFGRVRRLSEAVAAEAAASSAEFASVRLALTAEIASGYFTLRGLDRELALLREGIALRRRALELVSARRDNGASTDFDLARAETELASTEAEESSLQLRRAAMQNALAVLLGEAAPDFSFGTDGSLPTPLQVPAGLPGDLLERRPDVAAAESTLRAANARIGVAKAAFFPAVSLTGSWGYASSDIDRLVNADSRLWSIGPSLYLPVFQGGRNRANLARSRAAFDENIALYRQKLLVAFREVQDALTATRLLSEQAAAQDRALAGARRAGALAQTRYAAGYVNYFEVLDTQRTVLLAERASVQLGAQRLVNSVLLIKVLGGGWSGNNAFVTAN